MNSVSKSIVIGTVVIASCLFSSCNKWLESGEGPYYTSYGEIFGSSEQRYIVTDKGNNLNIVENMVPGFPVNDGRRIIANYSILDETASGYNIRLNAMDSVLTKLPVYPSTLTAEEQERLGNDPVYILDASFGGDKYLNLKFEVLRNSLTAAHLINLVVDEENSNGQQVVLTFRHNAFGDPAVFSAFGRASFDVSGLVPQGKDEINIVLKWRNYMGEERSASAVFRLGTDVRFFDTDKRSEKSSPATLE